MAVGKLGVQDAIDEGDDRVEIVVTAWKALKTPAQREVIVSLLDTFAFGETRRRA